MQGNIMSQLQEAARQRFGGAGQSSVGMSANPSASNPLTMRQNSAMPEQGNMMNGATGAIQTAQPGESQLLVKGLLKRLHTLPPA